jgi:hypothetical protein
MRALFLLVFLSTGCMTALRPYEPWVVKTGANPEAAVAAATAALLAAGFVEPAVEQGTLTAITPPSRGMRDHVVIAILAGGELAVDVRTEIAVGSAWLSPVSTCPTYDYLREKRLAALIVSKIHSME